ncbi:MAG: hypothetical protein CSA76_00320 [Spirochaetales bacterium]|nr:MAG: hypothetical protein CSA76_00320 [Spirochaetales bacterium]
MGLEDAAAVVSRLNADEAEELARHIAQVSRVDAVEAQQLLDEFGQHFSGVQAKRARGGKDAARNILEAAFGEDKAKAILASALPEEQPLPFSFLNDCSFEQLVTLLSKEPSSSLALVMAYLEPSLSSALLESLPDEQRAAVVIRMARTEKVSRDVLETVEDSLREKLRLIGRDESEELDGRAALADILRHMDLEDEKRLLGGLEDADPLLAHQVKEKLYTMDSVLHLRRKDLQQLLLDMDEKEIAMILKGQTPEIRQCIEEALSSRRKLLVEDERVILGPQPRSEVDKSVRSFLDRIQKAEEEGRFIILREESDLIE